MLLSQGISTKCGYYVVLRSPSVYQRINLVSVWLAPHLFSFLLAIFEIFMMIANGTEQEGTCESYIRKKEAATIAVRHFFLPCHPQCISSPDSSYVPPHNRHHRVRDFLIHLQFILCYNASSASFVPRS